MDLALCFFFGKKKSKNSIDQLIRKELKQDNLQDTALPPQGWCAGYSNTCKLQKMQHLSAGECNSMELPRPTGAQDKQKEKGELMVF